MSLPALLLLRPAPLHLELGLGTLNPRFAAWPLELGLGTLNPRFAAWPLELGLGTLNPRFVAWPLELALGTLNRRFVVWPPTTAAARALTSFHALSPLATSPCGTSPTPSVPHRPNTPRAFASTAAPCASRPSSAPPNVLEFRLGALNPRFVAWPLELGLGTRNPRFVAWPLELGLGTLNPRFVAWPLELGLGTLNPRFVAWPLELGLGTLNPRFVACEPYEGLFVTDRGDKGLTTDISRSVQRKIWEATVPRMCMRTHVTFCEESVSRVRKRFLWPPLAGFVATVSLAPPKS